jgi:hypothetical protein
MRREALGGNAEKFKSFAWHAEIITRGKRLVEIGGNGFC